MKVNLDKSFKNYKGEESGQVIKDTVCQCLYNAGEGFTPEEKYKAYLLVTRISAAKKDVDLMAEDITLIKRICEKPLTAGGYGQVVELMEGGNQDASKE